MLKVLLLIGFVTFGVSFSWAQDKGEDKDEIEARGWHFWRYAPGFIPVGQEEIGNHNALILEDNRYINFDLRKQKGKEIVYHKVIHIATEEGLNEYNTIRFYIPKGGELTDFKAKSINPDGGMREIGMDKVYNIEDVNGLAGQVKAFAIEGAVVGGQIEYWYTIESPIYRYGVERITADVPVKDFYLEIRCVSYKNINYNAQGHIDFLVLNKNDQIQIQDNDDEVIIAGYDLAAREDESYTYPRVFDFLVEYDYQLPYLYTGLTETKRYNSYWPMKTFLIGEFFNFESREIGLYKDFNESIEGLNTKEDKLIELFKYFREKVVYDENSNSQSPYMVLRRGSGDNMGMTVCFCVGLASIGIDNYEVLMTTDKTQRLLDEEFCSPYASDEFIVYLPDQDLYIYPASDFMPIDHVPSWIDGANAMVLTLEDQSVHFRKIEGNSADKNQVQIKYTIQPDVTSGVSLIDVEGSGTGQVAYDHDLDYYYSESIEEIQSELERIISWRFPDGVVESIQAKNESDWGTTHADFNKPYKRSYAAVVRSNSLFSRTENMLLVNIGRVLGPQSNLYNENERLYPIFTPFCKSYSYEIIFQIPEGYELNGVKGIDVDKSLKDENGKKIASFSTEVTMTYNNEIIINIEEYYDQVFIPKELYPGFSEVINAAANFNQATLLLKKVE